MGFSKNQKKKFRNRSKGIEEEIIKANQLNEINETSFDVKNKVKPTQLKYSTVPRVVVKKIREKVKQEVIDIWSKDYVEPVYSKRQQRTIRSIRERANANRPVQIIHPGMSYNPDPNKHQELLHMLAVDQANKEAENKKYEFKPTIENELIEPKSEESEEEEKAVEANYEMQPESVNKNKNLTAREKKRKLINMKQAEKIRQAHLTKKGEQHQLNNIPKIALGLKRSETALKQKTEAKKEMNIRKENEKSFKKQIANLPFQLPSELPTCLRLLVPEDPWQDLMGRVNVYRLRSDKTKKVNKRKTKKMYKKSGVV